MTDLTSTEIAALRVCVAIVFDGALKPKGSQADYTRDAAKRALEKLERKGKP